MRKASIWGGSAGLKLCFILSKAAVVMSIASLLNAASAAEVCLSDSQNFVFSNNGQVGGNCSQGFVLKGSKYHQSLPRSVGGLTYYRGTGTGGKYTVTCGKGGQSQADVYQLCYANPNSSPIADDITLSLKEDEWQ